MDKIILDNLFKDYIKNGQMEKIVENYYDIEQLIKKFNGLTYFEHSHELKLEWDIDSFIALDSDLYQLMKAVLDFINWLKDENEEVFLKIEEFNSIKVEGC